MEGVPVSGPLLCEKAMDLYIRMPKNLISLLARDGNGGSVKDMVLGSFLFKERNCRQTLMHLLNLPNHFLSLHKAYSLDQIFNCDETGLNFGLLPAKTLARSFEKSADGRKKSKDRVTLNLCSNA